MSMTSNIPTHIGLYLVEEDAIRDVVGREALIPQEIMGRAQVKLEQPQEIQIYLPTEGENDIARLNRLEQEIEKMRKWAVNDRYQSQCYENNRYGESIQSSTRSTNAGKYGVSYCL